MGVQSHRKVISIASTRSPSPAVAISRLPLKLMLTTQHLSSTHLTRRWGRELTVRSTPKKINWNTLPVGALVLVEFPDKTKAVFVKTNGSITDHWAWAGMAWDADGKPINRQGVQIVNPNSSGSGAGAANYSRTPTPSSSVFYTVGWAPRCTSMTTISIDSSVVSTVFTLVPC